MGRLKTREWKTWPQNACFLAYAYAYQELNSLWNFYFYNMYSNITVSIISVKCWFSPCIFDVPSGQAGPISKSYQIYDLSNKHQRNLAKGGIASHFCSLGGSSNLRLHVLTGGWPPYLLFPWVSGTPCLTQCVVWPHKCTCQMASKSNKRFKQGARIWQTI